MVAMLLTRVRIGGLFMSETETRELRKWERWWSESKKVTLKFMKTRRQKKGIYPYMAELAARVGGSALDVGCETCLAHPHFVELGLEYSGIDITKKFVDHDVARGIDVHLASALDIPFEDCSFDTVFCKDLLEHIHPDDVLTVIREMIRVARKQVLIVWFLPPKPQGRVWDRGYLRVRHKLDTVMGMIEGHDRFVGLTYATYGEKKVKTIWTLELKPVEHSLE